MGGLGTALHCSSGEMINDLIDGEIFVAYNVLGSYAAARQSAGSSIAVILPSDFPTTMMRTILISKDTELVELSVAFLRHLISFQTTAHGNIAAFLPPLTSGSEPSTIPLEPALLTYLDKLKRETFIGAWENAIIR